jgi:hypothetical protein
VGETSTKIDSGFCLQAGMNQARKLSSPKIKSALVKVWGKMQLDAIYRDTGSSYCATSAASPAM